MSVQSVHVLSVTSQADDKVLDAQAHRLAMQFSQADAKEILSHAINHEFKGRIALVSSFGSESSALLHLVSKVDKAIPVIFLDTDKHFAQTLNYRKKLAGKFGLENVLDIKPKDEEVTACDPGGDLWKSNADACCNLRKVAPLSRALVPFDAWITGRKQFHGGGRVHLPAFEASSTHIKVNPLIHWSQDEVAQYVADHDLPAHPLVAQGYPSIGCWPCTHPVAFGGDVRAGRWRGAAKTECGIHGQAR